MRCGVALEFADGCNLTEPRLILEAANGDLDAFNQLVLKYQGLVFSQACALLGDRHSAEDATQESFIKAFQNISRFRGRSLRSWLFRIVVNTCYDEMRWSKRHPTIPLILEDAEDCTSSNWLVDPQPSVQVIIEQKEHTQVLYRMLDELTEVYRNPITLIDLHELDYSKAAEVLEIPLGTLKSRLARARVQLKEKFQNNFFYSVNEERICAPELLALNAKKYNE